MPIDELLPLVRRELENENLWDPAYDGERKEWFRATVDMIRSRFHTLKDFVEAGRAYFADDYVLEAKPVKKNIEKHPEISTWLAELGTRLDALEEFSHDETERVTRAYADELGIKPGILINGMRTIVTGRAAGAGLFDILIAIGKRRVVERLKNVPAILERTVK
jgi:glutamyl-tRNA synthetase